MATAHRPVRTTFDTTQRIVALSNGNLLVDSWTDTGRFVQIWSLDGQPIGEPIPLDIGIVNAGADGGLTILRVIYDDAGGVMLEAQHYDAAGVAYGDPIVVREFDDAPTSASSITSLPDGRSVAVWIEYDEPYVDSGTLPYTVHTRVLDADGNLYGAETVIPVEGPGTLYGAYLQPRIAILDDRYILTWTGSDEFSTLFYSEYGDISPTRYAGYVQVFDLDGNAVSDPALVQTGPGQTPLGTVRAFLLTVALADGTFAVASRATDDPDTETHITVQIFDRFGHRIGNELRIGNENADQPSIAALPDGGFVVSWEELTSNGQSLGLRTQRFDVQSVATHLEGTAVTIPMSVSLHDTDGSETIDRIVVSGVPSGWTLAGPSGTTAARDGAQWVIEGPDLAGVLNFTLTPAAKATGPVTLVFRAFSQEASNLTEASHTASVTINFIGAEVTVTGNDVDISDGDSSPALADHTDFGVNLVNAFVERTFTVTNDGLADLTLSGLKLPKGFKLGTDKLLARLAPGQSDTFTVLLDTKKVGTYGGMLSFTTNDPDEKLFNFNLSGDVTAPEIAVTGNTRNVADNDKTPSATDHTDFGASAYGSAGTVRSFTISNTGNATLNITSIAVPAGFELVDPAPTSIAAGASATFDVALLTNAGTGLRQGDIVILNDDTNEAVFNFRIKANVTAEIVTGDVTDETFFAAAHAETFSGLDGSDTVSYKDATALVVANLASPKANKGFAAGDTYNGIENLTGSAFNDTLTGDKFDNTLSGGGGNDTLNGGTGNDILEGGAGADKLTGAAGTDTASYANASGAIKADLSKSANNLGEAAGDKYSAVENLTGSAFGDHLTGTTGVNAIDGGDGDDTIIGLGGIDRLTGGAGTDTFVFLATKDGGGATAASTKATGDLILDFESGTDRIGILRSGFKLGTLSEADFLANDYFVAGDGLNATTPTGVAATASHGQFLFNKLTNQMWWDADGQGKAKAVLLATFDNGAQVTAANFDLL
jgi:Ca2+-binding RTX toxin-like protein